MALKMQIALNPQTEGQADAGNLMQAETAQLGAAKTQIGEAELCEAPNYVELAAKCGGLGQQ